MMNSKELVDKFDSLLKLTGIKNIPIRDDKDYQFAGYILQEYSDDIIEHNLQEYISQQFVNIPESKVRIVY